MTNASHEGWTLQVSTTRINKWYIIVKHRPWKACFWCPLPSENAVFTFRIYSDCDQLGAHMDVKLVRVGAFETRKSAEVGFRKHAKNSHHKSTNTCHKYAPKRRSPKVVCLWFLGSPSQHGLQGVPGEAPRPKSISKWRPGHGFSDILRPCLHLLWSHFGNISCVTWTTNW